jgi:hypothetical protein
MSERRLTIQLQRPKEAVVDALEWTPVVLSDSKGKYLKNQTSATDYPENSILWWTRSGADTDSLYQWIKQGLRRQLSNHGKIHLYVWSGTCDLTCKQNRKIALADQEGEIVSRLIQLYKKFYKLTESHINLRVTILEVPYYSIERWNTHKGCQTSEEDRIQDQILKDQIDEINTNIRELNSDRQLRSPKFNLDVTWCRSAASKRNNYYIKFNLFKDGIHPDDLLAKVWLRNLTTTITRDCK